MEPGVKLVPTKLAGVLVIETSPVADHRGAFARWFCEHELLDVVGARRIVQINHSRTNAVGAVRGLHFQKPPHAEMKFVRCLKGRVFDVAVDLRAGSPTFLQWHAEELTPDSARMLAIPEGCAHGFQVLAAESELVYLHTAAYAPEAEGGVRFDDARLRIAWPLPIADLSERDRQLPVLQPDFAGISL
jgi:dTDP-4-dehydrorhamnose 3,5-epimerase